MKISIRSAIVSALLASASATAAHAQPGPRGRPSYELLATIPDLTAAQQQDIRRIESERRDAHDTLRIKQRNEQERIDEQSESRLRKTLGDDGYRRYAEWKTGRMAGPAGFPRPGMGRPHGHPRSPGANDTPPGPPAIDSDSDDKPGA
jgi:hypothetical protein